MAATYAVMQAGKQSGEWLVDLVNWWIYHKNNAGYRCILHLTCSVRVRVLNGLYFTTGNHNHANQRQNVINARFENSMKSIVQVRPGDMKQLFDDIRTRDHPDATTIYSSLYPTLLRYRHRSQPPVPGSVDALTILLEGNPFYR